MGAGSTTLSGGQPFEQCHIEKQRSRLQLEQHKALPVKTTTVVPGMAKRVR